MIEQLVRDRLEALPTAFSLVAGLAELSLLTDAPAVTPAAYVFVKDKAGGENSRMNGVLQRIEADVAIVIVVRNVADAAGAAALADAGDLERAVTETMLGWEPDVVEEPFTFVSSAVVKARAGVVFLEVVFGTAWTLEAA